MSAAKGHTGGANVVIISIVLAVFTGVAAFTYQQTHNIYQIGAFQFNKDAFKTEIEKFQTDQFNLIRVTCLAFFGLAIAVMILSIVFCAIKAVSDGVHACAGLLLGLPGLVMFCMMVYYCVVQKQIIDATGDSLVKKAMMDATVKNSIERAYSCKMGDNCAHYVMLPLTQFWFLGIFATLFINFAFSYIIGFFTSSY